MEGNARLRAGYPLNDQRRHIQPREDRIRTTKLPPLGDGHAVAAEAAGDLPPPKLPARIQRMPASHSRDRLGPIHHDPTMLPPAVSQLTEMLQTQYLCLIHI